MEMDNQSFVSGNGVVLPATEDPWLEELRQTVLSSFTQSRTGMEGTVKGEDYSVPWTISATVTILTSDGRR